MEVRCPHCCASVELESETPLSAITCSSCGSSFSLLGVDETASYQLSAQRHSDTSNSLNRSVRGALALCGGHVIPHSTVPSR